MSTKRKKRNVKQEDGHTVPAKQPPGAPLPGPSLRFLPGVITTERLAAALAVSDSLHAFQAAGAWPAEGTQALRPEAHGNREYIRLHYVEMCDLESAQVH